MKTTRVLEESLLISRDEYPLQEDKEISEVFKEISSEIAKKIKGAILLYFRNKGIEKFSLEMGNKKIGYKFAEDGVYSTHDSETLTDTVMLFYVYKKTKNIEIFNKEESFSVEPAELLMQSKGDSTFIAEFFNLASKRITIETLISRIVEEIRMNLIYPNVSRKLPPLFRREMNRNGFNL